MRRKKQHETPKTTIYVEYSLVVDFSRIQHIRLSLTIATDVTSAVAAAAVASAISQNVKLL